MFHTNYTQIEKEFRCDADCVETGGCSGHKMTLKINNTVGSANLIIDGKYIHVFDCNEAEALYEMLRDLRTK